MITNQLSLLDSEKKSGQPSRNPYTCISNNIDQLIASVQKQNKSYQDFIISLFEAENHHRQQNEFKRRLKAAQLPLNSELETTPMRWKMV